MTKRDNWLLKARIAGYHLDSATYTRLQIERSGVTFMAMRDAWQKGIEQFEGGMKCGCYNCTTILENKQ